VADIIYQKKINRLGFSRVLELVLTRFFLLSTVLSRLDLPTLERPAKLISGRFPDGIWLVRYALRTNDAVENGLFFPDDISLH
jgi:hypothetical protein